MTSKKRTRKPSCVPFPEVRALLEDLAKRNESSTRLVIQQMSEMMTLRLDTVAQEAKHARAIALATRSVAQRLEKQLGVLTKAGCGRACPPRLPSQD